MERPGSLTSSQILLVDDQDGTLRLLSIMLERDGFRTLSASGGHVALDILERVTPDLIIADVMMPGMDGIELCRRIRALPRTAQTPVMMLSAIGDLASIEKAFEAGADDFLSKPILHCDLVSKARELLREKASVQTDT